MKHKVIYLVVLIVCFFISLTIWWPETKTCEYCESSDVKYAANFINQGNTIYLCEDCHYQHSNSSPQYDHFWQVKPIK